ASRLLRDMYTVGGSVRDRPGVDQAAGGGGYRDVCRLVIGSMRLSRKLRMIGIQFWGAPVDGLAFVREFLEGPAGGARVAATGRRRLGHQPCGKDRQSGDGADYHESYHCSLLGSTFRRQVSRHQYG